MIKKFSFFKIYFHAQSLPFLFLYLLEFFLRFFFLLAPFLQVFLDAFFFLPLKFDAPRMIDAYTDIRFYSLFHKYSKINIYKCKLYDDSLMLFKLVFGTLGKLYKVSFLRIWENLRLIILINKVHDAMALSIRYSTQFHKWGIYEIWKLNVSFQHIIHNPVSGKRNYVKKQINTSNKNEPQHNFFLSIFSNSRILICWISFEYHIWEFL